MVILDRYAAADVPATALEAFMEDYDMVLAVEDHLTTIGQDGLLIEFLKLQQDYGVQIDLERTLTNTNISVGNESAPKLRYGIDEGAIPPGEHTERTYMAYEAVTLSRLNQLLPRIHAHISDSSLAQRFKVSLEKLGLVSYPVRETPLSSPSPPSP